MKTCKLILGIISLVLCSVVLFQSCAAGIGNALSENGEVSGSAGIIVALCLLIAGIIGIAARKSKAGGIVSGCFYAFGGLIGIINHGSYSDLIIWSVISFIFAAVFLLGSILDKRSKIER